MIKLRKGDKVKIALARKPKGYGLSETLSGQVADFRGERTICVSLANHSSPARHGFSGFYDVEIWYSSKLGWIANVQGAPSDQVRVSDFCAEVD